MLICSFIFILICILGYCLTKGIKSSYELLDEMEKEIFKNKL